MVILHGTRILTSSHRTIMLAEAIYEIFIASVAADWARKATLHPIDTMATRSTAFPCAHTIIQFASRTQWI